MKSRSAAYLRNTALIVLCNLSLGNQCVPNTEPIPRKCATSDCGGDTESIFGTLSATGLGSPYEVTICRNGSCLPSQSPQSQPEGTGNGCVSDDQAVYCASDVTSGTIFCGDIVVPVSGPTVCLDVSIKAGIFPKQEGDQYRIVVKHLGEVVVDRTLMAHFVEQQPVACDNSTHVSCRNAFMKF
jgi:hypothetical protein